MILSGDRQNSWKDTYPGSAASPESVGDKGGGSVLLHPQWLVLRKGSAPGRSVPLNPQMAFGISGFISIVSLP